MTVGGAPDLSGVPSISGQGYVATKIRKPREVPVSATLRDDLDGYLLTIESDEHAFGAPRWVDRATGRAQAVDGARAACARPP
jgi:hypothetical protein